MAKKLKIWNGASWEDVTFAITPPNTSVTNSFSTNQVIDASTSVAALRVTQRGTGEALRVEDDTNPDSTPFVITSTGQVGMGTDAPDSALQISGSGDTAINITKTGQSAWYLQSLSSGAFRIYSGTASSERIRIDSSGNIGIGTATPASKLHVNGSFRQTGATVPYEWTVNAGGTDYLKLNAVGYADNILVLSADGNVGFGIAPTFKIHTYHALGSSVGSQALAFQSQVNNGNQDYFKVYQERTSTNQSWSGSDWILRRHVDATPMGGFKWAASEWNPIAFYGAPNDRSVRTTYISTGTPSGGSDGDLWATYV